MVQKRWKLSSAQRADMWSRWKAGQSLHAIGRVLGKDHRVIRFLLARHGGIAPAARRRSRRVLTLAERENISRGIASGCSMRVIAQGLSRALSTVSREMPAMAGARSIAPTKPINEPGSRPCGPNRACWPRTASYKRSLRVN
jgi:Helix-turn-helix domain